MNYGRGFIKIRDEFMEEYELLEKIFAKFIPVRIDVDNFEKVTTYYGYSKEFEICDDTTSVKEYVVTITKKYGEISSVTFN